MKTMLLAAVAAVFCVFQASCNTTIGLGRDMRILGENMEHAANKKTGGGDGGGYQDSGGAPVY